MAIVISVLVSIVATDVSEHVDSDEIPVNVSVGNLTGIATSAELQVNVSGQCLYAVNVSGGIDEVTWLGSMLDFYDGPCDIDKGDALTGYVALRGGYIDGFSNDYWLKKTW